MRSEGHTNPFSAHKLERFRFFAEHQPCAVTAYGAGHRQTQTDHRPQRSMAIQACAEPQRFSWRRVARPQFGRKFCEEWSQTTQAGGHPPSEDVDRFVHSSKQNPSRRLFILKSCSKMQYHDKHTSCRLLARLLHSTLALRARMLRAAGNAAHCRQKPRFPRIQGPNGKTNLVTGPAGQHDLNWGAVQFVCCS